MGDGFIPDWDALQARMDADLECAIQREMRRLNRSRLSVLLEGIALPFDLDAIRVQPQGRCARLLRWFTSRWNDA